jgi:hypothetical protein
MLCAYFKPLLFHLHKDDTKDFLSSRKGVLDLAPPVETMENKTFWSKILNILITVLTAIGTTFTTTLCIDML